MACNILVSLPISFFSVELIKQLSMDETDLKISINIISSRRITISVGQDNKSENWYLKYYLPNMVDSFFNEWIFPKEKKKRKAEENVNKVFELNSNQPISFKETPIIEPPKIEEKKVEPLPPKKIEPKVKEESMIQLKEFGFLIFIFFYFIYVSFLFHFF